MTTSSVLSTTTLPFRPDLFSAGEKLSGDPLAVNSPWDGSVVGMVPTGGKRETADAIDAAHHATRNPLPAYRRAEILDGAAARIEANRDALARILALEIGKPVSQALIEVDRCVQTFRFSAAEARTLTGTGVAFDAHPAGVGHRGFTIRVPIGVIAAITPFNFPLNLAAHKVGPAVATGCGVVLKPSREAPLAAAALAYILYDAGLPREALSVVVGSSSQIGDVLIADDRVGMITFTGSSEVGWQLAARAPQKRVSLELGNSTPLIVCADADLSAAAGAVAASGFAFAGQSCISVQRVIVERSVHDRFVDELIGASAGKTLGDPLDPATFVGPLINNNARDRVADWIEEAQDSGATPIVDSGSGGPHLGPTVLDQVDPSDRVWHDEVFGPVVGIRTFESFSEAIEAANATEYGLQAGIFTMDIRRALDAAEQLDFGGVTINETPTFRVDQMPYGGTKISGNTREGPRYTVREMTEERVVVIGG
ncbi:MAG: aldehyde dehydrogenase family protein [bacterium]|nr:aldehyde dehydrogenase family protein [bacterium]